MGWSLFSFWTLKHVFKLCCTFWIDLILGDFFSLSTQHLRIQRMSRRLTSESNVGNCKFIPLKKMYRLHHVQWSILPHPCISLHYFSWLSQPSCIFYWYSVKEGQGLLCTAKSELTLKQKKRKQSWKSDLSMFHGEETISFWMFCR